MVCQSTSLQKQAQFITVGKKAFNLPLLPCLNAASSPAQKVLLLCIDFSRNGVLKQSMKGVETLNKSLTEFRQPLQVQSHLEMPGILVQLGHIQRT